MNEIKRYSVTENLYEGLKAGAAHSVVMASDYDALLEMYIKQGLYAARLQKALQQIVDIADNDEDCFEHTIARLALAQETGL